MYIFDRYGVMHQTSLHDFQNGFCRPGKRPKPGRYGLWGSFGQAVSRRIALTIVLVAALFPAGLSAAAAEPIRLVALGDSLMAGYELPASAAFPQQLEAALREEGYAVEVINAGVSGDTASAGRDRLGWAVPDDVDGVIVELGANDALRGIDPATTRAALTEIVERLRSRNVEVLLAGMMAPSNLDAEYREPFEAIYRDLAAAHDLVFYPFFLEGVAMEPSLNLSDGMHPNEEGVKVIVEGILPYVEELIARIEAHD